MNRWMINETRPITVVTDKNVDLAAYYTLSNSSSYTQISSTFTKNGDRYYLDTSFSVLGKYMLRIVDLNGLINDLYVELEIVEVGFESLDSKIDGIDQEVWTYNDRTVTAINGECESSGMTQAEHDKLFAMENYVNLHSELDAYANKADWKANDIDMTETNDLIVSSKDEIIAELEEGENNIKTTIENIQNGNWEIINNQMIMKSVAGEEIARFNLLDAGGNPTMRSVYKRERV